MFFIIVIALFLLITTLILDNHPEAKEKIVSWLKDTLKWIAICTVAVALLLAMVYFSMPARAETEFVEVYGKIVAVNFNTSEVFVETSEGEIYVFFAEGYIKTQGQVYLLLFGDEVIDVIFITELEAPFGEFSFFIFTKYVATLATK